jgi:hypothetical protein
VKKVTRTNPSLQHKDKGKGRKKGRKRKKKHWKE